MNDVNIVLTVIGGLMLLQSLLHGLIYGKSLISAPMVALGTGIALGPLGFGVLELETWGDPRLILEETARLTLGIGLMGVALRLPRGYFSRQWRDMALLLGLLMPLMWLSTTLFVWWLLPLGVVPAMLVGAVLTPTDPVVASSIVVGPAAERNLPARLRQVISAESGANDGLAYPFVLLPILLLTLPRGEVWTHWLLNTVLHEVVGAALVGVLIGWLAGHLLLRFLGERGVGHLSLLSYTLALSLFLLGAAKLMGTDGVLAVFIGGLAYDWVIRDEGQKKQEHIQEAIAQFFTLPAFALLGLALPVDAWVEMGWTAVWIAAGIPLLRRVPALLVLAPALLRLPGGEYRFWRDILFSGWFGPVGIAAVFYATLVTGRSDVQAAWTVGSLVVCASIVGHGISANPLIALYGKRGGREDVRAEQDL
jgi:NhaP-type Na+/H+ or K+/H+ antiporter